MKHTESGARKAAANMGAIKQRAISASAAARASAGIDGRKKLRETKRPGGFNRVSYVSAELLPHLVRVARVVTPDPAEREARVLRAWCEMAGLPRWTPEMVRAVNREMALCA